jgi:uncharacterized protein (DUF58 family)
VSADAAQRDPRVRVDTAHLRSFHGAARGLDFLPRRLAGSALNGRHASRLRGRGLNFEEMRHYVPGDDVRAIDWRATARSGRAHVRVLTEERDRPALLLVDQRMSMFFGSTHNMKSVTAAEAAALAAFSVLGQGDRVGGLVFDDERVLERRPQRSARAVSAFLEAVVDRNRALHPDRLVGDASDTLDEALAVAARLAHHDHLVMVFSDFGGIGETTRRRLSGLAAHNDVVLFLVFDPVARGLPGTAPVVVGDGRRQAELDLASPSIRALLEASSAARLDRILAWQREINLSVLPLSAGEETLPQIRRLLLPGAP